MSDIIITPNIIGSEARVYSSFLYSPSESSGVDIRVQSQFPEFVAEDHPRFIDFMQSYYEWMETQNGVLNNSRNLKNQQNIETASGVFEEQLFREFLVNIPREVLVNKATLLKHIKDFYRARGTKKSYEFFFRLLFNTSVELYYPQVDILKVSDGKWIKNKTIKIIKYSGNIESLKGQKLRGTITNSTAIVERILTTTNGIEQGLELFFNLSSISGTFLPNEVVVSQDNQFFATISPIPVSYEILNSGTGYQVNQIFEIISTGRGAKVRVTQVDLNGAILNLEIQDYGMGYDLQNPPSLYNLPTNPKKDTSQPENTPAKIKFTLGAVTDYPGFYLNDDGQLSTGKYLHDGEYYQQFSYVTLLDQSKNYYENLMNRLIHPLGFKHFGGVRLEQFVSSKIKTAQNTTPVKIVYFGSYPQTQPLASAKAKAYTNIIVKHDINKDKHSLPLGPSYTSINREKFNYKPFLKFNANVELNSTTNPNYFGPSILDPRSNTPVAVFEKIGLIKPKDVEEFATRKTDLVPDAVVRHNEIVIKLTTKPENKLDIEEEFYEPKLLPTDE